MKYSKVLLLLTVLIAATPMASAQDTVSTDWIKSAVIDLTATQSSYSDSWTGGEVGSFNWQTNLNASAEKQLRPKFNYKGTLKLSFGQTHTQDPDTKNWKRPQKSTDLIDWENVGRFTLNKALDPYVAFRLESQFYDGSNRNKKLWLSPMKLTESAGLSRTMYKKDEDAITSRLGVALRQIITSSIINDTTLATSSTTTNDGGLESVTDAALTLHQNIKYTSKLTLYKALFFSESDAVKGTEFEDDWKAIDVNWENIISASVTKLITVNLYTQLLYDKEISKKGRLKETLAVGFSYKMF